ncbi:hypothetical protein LPTSP4_23390 [Leptospira ryugenii]|uniref:Phytanoyl-CoA dioxygenase PhyH n=1 Tax=Leptospira ryugenii TaxID=1917863 RepID=A0A2P2E1Q5_9LEPT|nr:hypothetical protein [Leptospira ryugenii]GBF50812.1 hypothetical protein LPTSP4_23390 [Leptospira ryugenii]
MDSDTFLFDGKIGRIQADSLHTLSKEIQDILSKIFFEGDPRIVANHLEEEEFFNRMSFARREVQNSNRCRELILKTWTDMGYDLNDIYMDLPRLRCVPHHFHLNERAMAISFLHRDPWYANPQSQINHWIPIYEVERKSGFAIYPAYFSKPVLNNSNLFDYSKWLEMGGFQSKERSYDSIRIFPSPLEDISSEVIDIFGNPGELIAFSPQHLHGTSPNNTGKARFSLELRFVCLSHLEQKIGPENKDNASRGTTLIHMVRATDGLTLSKKSIEDYVSFFALS